MSSAEINGVELSYRIAGDGPPLVLIAGTGYPGATWRPGFVEPLAAACQVVMFDHRGTGESSSSDNHYSTRMFAEDLAGLCDHLGIGSAHFLGHSMGGRVAQWLALDRPSMVRSLILAASGPGDFQADSHYTRGIPVGTARRLIELGYEDYMARHIRETFFPASFSAAHPEVVDDLVASFWEHRPDLNDYLKHIDARQRHQTTERLADIAMPALMLVGDVDTGARGTGSHLAQSRFLATHLPNANMTVLEGNSHGFIWQEPGRSASLVLDWIERHEP